MSAAPDGKVNTEDADEPTLTRVPIVLGDSVRRWWKRERNGAQNVSPASDAPATTTVLRFVTEPPANTSLDGAHMKLRQPSSATSGSNAQFSVATIATSTKSKTLGKDSGAPAKKRKKLTFEGVTDTDSATDGKNFVLLYNEKRKCYILEKPGIFIHSIKPKGTRR